MKRFFDVNNGHSCPMTWEEVLGEVIANPIASSRAVASMPFFFSEDGSENYSCEQIAKILGIELQYLEDQN